MAAVREVLGKIKCHGCGEPVAAKKQNGTGFPCYSCPWCGLFVQAHAAASSGFLTKLVEPLKAGEVAADKGEVRGAPEKKEKEKKPAAANEEKTIFDYLPGARKSA